MVIKSRDDRQTAQKRQTVTVAVRLAYTPARMQPTETLTTIYTAQADELESLISITSVAEISSQPGENRWSVLQIVGHLADAELLASVRLRRIITQDRANLFGYKQETWADRLNYSQRKIETITARFTLLRRENAELLSELENEAWNLTGAHDEYGVLSLRQLIEGYVEHTAKHLNQIRRTLADLGNQ
jgi:hypothetical protein